MNREEADVQFNKEIVKIALLEFPAMVLIALGLYGKLEASEDSVLPVLHNSEIANSMLIIGGALLIWGSFKIFTLIKERAENIKDKL